MTYMKRYGQPIQRSAASSLFNIINDLAFQLIILGEIMKDRMVYSPKNIKPTSHQDINFKKSPQKFAYYDYPQQHRQPPLTNINHYYPPPQNFDNVKKISDDASSLRQTMNLKKAQQIVKRQILQFNEEQQKPNKLNDFLRQTMSYKSTKAFSERFGSEFTNTNEITVKKDDVFSHYKSLKSQDPYRITQSKSAVNLLEGQSSLMQCQFLNKKMDRNRKIIDQLRKSPKQPGKDYLKNVNHNKSPVYLDLDREKQIDDKGFRKKKKYDSAQFMTPKLDKGTYDTRFNSSPLINIDQRNHDNKAKQPTIVSPTTASIKRKISLNSLIKQSIPTDDYEIGKKLGEGKFGCVNLAVHKKTLGIFALKKIPKALIKSHMMVDQLALEIRLQSCLNHQNILQMYGFFDDKTHLYIVLEYMNGGTLYEKLKKGKISEKETAAIVRQITSSIDYLHDLGIAHRDLKPQNIVISNNVYKLCDFGWAAMCNQRRKTYCGTFDYVAPEILQGVDYDMTVDLWCLGVMTYELLTGKAPFYHISRKQTMKRILNVQNQTIAYPETMSEQARDFIDKLIKKNPLQRIKASQALLHPFLKDADFD